MPRVESNQPHQIFTNPMQSFPGELPRTTFRNMEDSVQVKLMSSFYPSQAMNEMVQATHSATVPSADFRDPRMRASLEGRGMWMLQEIPQYVFRITGVSRIFTHQLVRQRIGVTFMQQCTGDTDFRHADIIVPGCIANNRDQYEAFETCCLEAKIAYAMLLDTHIPAQSARYLLPMSISTYIYMQASLATLVALYKKRCCTMSQTWEMALFAGRLKTELLCYRPGLIRLFEEPCASGKCWFQGAKNEGTWTPLWQPDKLHDTYPWVAEELIHVGTNAEISSPRPTKIRLPRTYQGRQLQAQDAQL